MSIYECIFNPFLGDVLSLGAQEASDVSSALAKGKRVRAVRMLAGLTRKEFHEKHNIHTNTLKSWENPNLNQSGLTKKGAKRFIDSLSNEGILCTVEWLLDGLGSGPKLSSQQINSDLNIGLPEISINQDIAISKEVQFFLDVNANAVAARITDYKMSPIYQPNDFVGGYKRFGENIKNFLNTNCIIETIDGRKIVGRILPVHGEGEFYELLYLNEESSGLNKEKIKVTSIAPIVWHRRRDMTYDDSRGTQLINDN